MQDSGQNKENAVCGVQESEDAVDRSRCGAAGPKRQQRLERAKRTLGRDEICSLLKKIVKATDTRTTGVSVENRYGRMLAKLFRAEPFQSLAERWVECVSVNERNV